MGKAVPRRVLPTVTELNQLIAMFNSGRLIEVASQSSLLIERYPDSGFAWKLLGITLYRLGKNAMPALKKAAQLLPNDAEVHFNLGVSQSSLGQLDAAVASYRWAIRIKPDYISALNNLARLLMDQGRSRAAFDLIIHSLHIEDMAETHGLFVGCVLRFKFTHADGFVRKAMIRALSEPWCRPVDLAWVSADIVKLNQCVGESIARATSTWPKLLPAQDLFGVGGIKAISDDELLCCYLKSAPVCSLEMERFLTMMRFTLLVAASVENPSEDVEETILNLYGALAQQCFINEYIFACADSEATQAWDLRNLLTAALESESRIPAFLILAVASYFPLNTLPLSHRFLERSWPATIKAVLVQQVREPEEEQRYRITLPRLTAINDKVSLLVQSQYEENPYPRWIKVAPAVNFGTIDRMLRLTLPVLSFRPLSDNRTLDILIAGCGTGQQSIETAQNFPAARLLAIDLSLTSLGYAKRKSQELGLDNIEYAQADIMKLEFLDRDFDIIESTGVLHHLADPLAGWKVLLSLLRPGGFMRLGFYSEVARRGVVLARTFIYERGYGSTAEDIRQCRQELLGSDNGITFGAALKLVDFFTISACRDLLFHVQEHHMTLAGIDTFLRENDLQFLGLELKPDILEDYRRRFPDDQTALNLGNWQVFENEHPDLFLGMYQFWIQKAA